jgi:hypothetical protein
MKAFVAVLLCALGVIGCAAPVPPVTPVTPAGSPASVAPPSQVVPPAPVAPPSPAPSASPSVVVTCLGSPQPGAASTAPSILPDCSHVVSAVLTAVSGLGYPVQAVTVRIFDFSCGGPFATGIYFCPMIPAGPGQAPGSAYVMFAGTDKVAALSFHGADDPPIVAKIVAFEVPPAGWSMPAP